MSPTKLTAIGSALLLHTTSRGTGCTPSQKGTPGCCAGESPTVRTCRGKEIPIIHAEPEVVYRISEEGIVFGGMAGVTKNTVPYSSILRHPCRLCQCGTCAAVEDCMRMGPPTDLVPGPCALCRRLGNSVVTDCPGYTTEEDLDRENAAQKGNGKKAPRNCLLRHLASWSKKKGRKQHEPHKTNRHRLGALAISRRHE